MLNYPVAMEEQNLMREQANVLSDRAFRHQMNGELGHAIALYRRSINTFPTAEAHTYLGWTYSMMDRHEEAISECKKAILLDPSFGNPYNDIGAYLIELNRPEDAIPWLERAMTAPRYETPQFAQMNLGRERRLDTVALPLGLELVGIPDHGGHDAEDRREHERERHRQHRQGPSQRARRGFTVRDLDEWRQRP